MRNEVYKELTEHILPFWKTLRDEQQGGYYGYVDYDLRVDKAATKGCILNSRILWFFSTCCYELKDESLLVYAKHAYDYLCQHCLDKEQGGVYWSLHADGRVADDTKHTYNQAFAIYALAAYHRASGEPQALALAQRLFCLIEDHCKDEGGYLEAFTRDWKPAKNDKLSENGVEAARTMNTLLHVFEAYAGLYETAPSADIAACLVQILDLFSKKMYNANKKRLEVFLDHNYRSLIDLHSYGHDIETAWLLDWGCDLLKDEALSQQISTITTALSETVLKTAYHNNALYNECENGKDDTHQVWWVQAEGVVGFVNAWQKSGEDRFLQAAENMWGSIRTHLIDPRPGSEWFWLLDETGRPVKGRPIVEPWKCPYHNGRMCIELLRRLPV